MSRHDPSMFLAVFGTGLADSFQENFIECIYHAVHESDTFNFIGQVPFAGDCMSADSLGLEGRR